MNKGWMRYVVLVALVLGLWQGCGHALAQNDTTPPAFQSLEFSSTTVAAGGSVTVTARITDDVSGVDRASISFRVASGQSISGQFSRFSGTAQDGIWKATVTVPAAYPSGTYTFSFASVTDAASNSKNVWDNMPEPPFTGTAITVTGLDAAPPVVQSLSVSPASVQAGGLVTVTARITDATGVKFANVTFRNGAGQTLSGSFTRDSGTAQDGIYKAYILTTTSTMGTYAAFSLAVEDTGGNARTITAPDAPLGGVSFAVTAGTAPTITGMSATSGPIAGGTPIMLTGTNFKPGARVTIGGIEVATTVVNATTITFTTPTHTAGAVTVSVRNTDGQSGDYARMYLFVSPLPAVRSAAATVARMPAPLPLPRAAATPGVQPPPRIQGVEASPVLSPAASPTAVASPTETLPPTPMPNPAPPRR